MAGKNAVTVTGDKANAIMPLDQKPDYLQVGERTGLEALGQGDFKMPRILMLQPLSPQVKVFQGIAIPGEFWHSGLNVSLGPKFRFVPCVATKKVILWNPRDSGGGILAFSRNAKDWDSGARTQHEVKLKGKKEKVVWDTGRDVQHSGLTKWGSSDPDEPNSQPAATEIYEYLIYLLDKPDLSPVILGCYKTALPNAKGFNTSLLMLKNPITSVAVDCFAEAMNNDTGEWTVPQFQLSGYVPKEVHLAAKALGEKYADYNVDYDQDDVETKDNDEIPF